MASRHTPIVVALIGAAATISAALIAAGVVFTGDGGAQPAAPEHPVAPGDGTVESAPFPDVNPPHEPPDAGARTISLEPTRGPTGTRVAVRGEGFGPGERVRVTAVFEEELATVNAGADGMFAVQVTVPADAGRPAPSWRVFAYGEGSRIADDRAVFTVTD